MHNAIWESLSLVDASGQLIITAIVVFFVLAVCTNLVTRARYGSMARELQKNSTSEQPFSHRVLRKIFQEARARGSEGHAEVNIQALVEDSFQSELRLILTGERFSRAATGLLIILGLLGTFYGLTVSIGKLVTLVSSEASGVSDMTQALTLGLTEALSGMAVAFSTSLFGIVGAVALTLLGVVSNVTDRRTALMIQIENHVDRMLAREFAAAGAGYAGGGLVGADARSEQLQNVVNDFGRSVLRLEGAVSQFDSALQTFATTTRDFREFNLHLKDNVQRMSLSFGDFSEALKARVNTLKMGGHD